MNKETFRHFDTLACPYSVQGHAEHKDFRKLSERQKLFPFMLVCAENPYTTIILLRITIFIIIIIIFIPWLFSLGPFLSRWMVGKSFDTCGLNLTGCFPPCCGGNVSMFSLSLYTGSGLNHSITYNTSNTTCSRVFVPYWPELQDTMLQDRGKMFHAAVMAALPGTSWYFVANISSKNTSDLLCKTQCSNSLILPLNLKSFLFSSEFCYRLKFIITFPNTTLLVPDSVNASLGGVPCQSSTVQANNSIIIQNCVAGPYSSVYALNISTATFSTSCPEEPQIGINNYTLEISK